MSCVVLLSCCCNDVALCSIAGNRVCCKERWRCAAWHTHVPPTHGRQTSTRSSATGWGVRQTTRARVTQGETTHVWKSTTPYHLTTASYHLSLKIIFFPNWWLSYNKFSYLSRPHRQPNRHTHQHTTPSYTPTRSDFASPSFPTPMSPSYSSQRRVTMP